MGYRLLTDDIVGVVNLPITKNTLNFLQDAYTSETVALAKSMIYNYEANKVYRLDGFQTTLSGTADWTWTEGTLLYNDEIFFIESGALTTGVGEVLTIIINTSFLGTDPVEFRPSGSGSFNVHQIKTMDVVSAVTGSNVFDVSEIRGIVRTEKIEIGTWNMNTTATRTVVSALFFPNQIVGVEVVINSDDDFFYNLYHANSASSWQSSGHIIWYSEVSTRITKFDMERNPTSSFQSQANFSGAGNRGYINVSYEI